MAKKKSRKSKTKTVRKSSKRAAAARKAARTKAEKKAKRSLAAKKGARIRKRKGHSVGEKKPRRRKKAKRDKRKVRCKVRGLRKVRAVKVRARRKHKAAEAAEPKRRRRRSRKHAAAAPKRRRRVHGRRRRHHVRRMNPIHGWGEGLAATGGLLVGAVMTIIADRYTSTHALLSSGTTINDQPGIGQTYNASAPATPIWSSWKRLVAAGANLVVPLGGAMLTKKHPKTQSFFQTYFIASLAVTGSKLIVDVLPKMLGSKASGARLFAPEIDAQNARLSVKASNVALPAYTLVAGGTGPAAVAAATGSNMLGSANDGPAPPPYTAPTPSVPPSALPTPGPTAPGIPTPAPNGPGVYAPCAQCQKDDCAGHCDDEWDQFSQLRAIGNTNNNDQAAQ